jgi:hypothetical protein
MYGTNNGRYGQGWVWLGIGLILVAGRWFMRLAAPAPPFVRVQVVASPRGEPLAEVWLEGKAGDTLTRLTDHGKHGERWTTGVALMRAHGLSPELPLTIRTAAGRCRIRRYHLLTSGVETDTLALE